MGKIKKIFVNFFKGLIIGIIYFIISFFSITSFTSGFGTSMEWGILLAMIGLILHPTITIIGVTYFKLQFRYVLLCIVIMSVLAMTVLLPIFSIGLVARPRRLLDFFGSVESQTFLRFALAFIIQFTTFIPIWIVQFIKKCKSKRRVLMENNVSPRYETAKRNLVRANNEKNKRSFKISNYFCKC